MEYKKAKQDLITMLLIMVLSLILRYILIPSQIQLRASSNPSFNAQTFPVILSVALFVISFVGALNAGWKLLKLRKENASEKEAKAPIALKKILQPAAVFLIAVFYGWAFSKLGYIVSTLIATSAVLLVLGCKKWQYYASVYGFCMVVYLVFKVILLVPIP